MDVKKCERAARRAHRKSTEMFISALLSLLLCLLLLLLLVAMLRLKTNNNDVVCGRRREGIAEGQMHGKRL